MASMSWNSDVFGKTTSSLDLVDGSLRGLCGSGIGKVAARTVLRLPQRTMTTPTHSVRNSLADKERSFTLGPDALHWSDAGGGGRMPYGNVRDVRLIAYTSPIGETYQCTLRANTGDKVKLRSAHCVSLNNFEDRGASYAPFVRALISRIAAAAPHAKFIASSTALWIVWLIVGLLGLGVFVLLILSMFEGLPAAGPWVVAIAVCVIAASWAWRRAREGAAKTFDPAAPPPALLGQS